MPGCPNCGAENRADAKFCGECGSAFAALCTSCGTANEPGRKFCFECGSSLAPAGTSAPPTAEREAPVAERRHVAVLFADLVGFTTLSESRDSEEVRELLSRYFDTSRRIIELYGGTVEKFIGDAVMAVWGTPVATEDDPERAVRAALDLVAAVAALGQEVGAPGLRARAGVLTGEAAVTIGADGQGMVAGDLVNTASRIQSAAEPGHVFVGEATRRATEQAVVYEDAGAFELKGKEGLTQLWRALRVVSGVGGTLKSHGLEAPFVGRDRELRQIKDLFHICAGEQKAHLVSVTGIAGIGKSRLVWEFYKYFDGLAQVIYWHRGRCLAYGEGVTYWALADMVRMRCRIAEDEEQESALAKLRATLAEHIVDADERRYVEPRLAQLLSLGDSEIRDRQDLFAAWRLFFERLAETNPTILAFEDMQWADASLLDFVEHLIEWSRNHPIFVVTMARPELVERRPTWGAGHRNFTSLYLDPLSEQAMSELLAGLVPGLPAGLRDQILARAEGVPLYAVETVRMLLDRSALVQEGSVYQVVGTVDQLEVPGTLHALIAARLDGLSADERRLLQDGAVLGKAFTRAGIAALTGLSDGELDPILASLVRKEVLGLQSDPRSPEHGQYTFLQDLVRHVAYETLSKRDRRARHLAAVEYLSSALAEEEVAEVVASHLVEAYQLDSQAEDAAELRERARLALVGAGERAASLAASAEAQRYFRQASELADDPVLRASLLDRAGQMAWRANQPADARELYEQALALFDAGGETRSAARASARLGEVDFADGHVQDAISRLESALATLEGADDEDVAAVGAQLGRFLIFTGDVERAAMYLEQALDLAEALDLPETLVQAIISKSLLYYRRDRRVEARILLEGAVTLALSYDLHSAALRAYNNLAVIADADDRLADSLSVSERALELARRVGDRTWESTFDAGFVGLFFLAGRWDEAVARARESLEVLSTTFSQSNALDVVLILCERGEVAEARELIDRFGTVADSDNIEIAAGHALFEARVLRAEGKFIEALGRAEEVAGHRERVALSGWVVKMGLSELFEAAIASGKVDKAAQVLAVLDDLRPGELTPFLAAQRSRFRARLAAPGAAGAAAAFIDAARRFDELGMPFFRACVLLEHAEWLVASGQPSGSGPLLEAAKETFERIGAAPWLARLERAAVSRQPARA